MYSKVKKKSTPEFFNPLTSPIFDGIMSFVTIMNRHSVMLIIVTLSLMTSHVDARNVSDDDPNADPDIDCGNGVMIPIWRAHKDITTGTDHFNRGRYSSR